MKIMSQFVELLRESVIFQGVITLIVLGVWGYLIVTGQPVPDTVQLLAGTVVGFFFGGKYAQQVGRSTNEAVKLMKTSTPQ